MKPVYFLKFFILLNLVIFIASCKHDCPDPVDSTTYVATLRDGIEDSYISSHYPTTNPSNDKGLEVVSWTENGNWFTRKSYIKFDYSSIPAGATIKKATLTLHPDTLRWIGGHSTLDGPNNWFLRRVTSDWQESTITWNNQPNDDVSTQLSLPGSTSYKQTFTIDVTNFVKDEITTPATAFGFMMQLANETNYNGLSFASSEHTSSNLRPTLEIEYTK